MEMNNMREAALDPGADVLSCRESMRLDPNKIVRLGSY